MPEFEFNADDLSRLRKLRFAARLPQSIHHEGQHRTRRAGEGLEFLDYRPYVSGDDLRRLDWSLYGRLRQLMVRVYERPEDLSITLLVDVSRSMSFGEPVSKAAHACRIACALAYVALTHGERLSVATFSNRLDRLAGPFQQKAQLGEVVRYYRQCPIGGATDLPACMLDYCCRRRRRGLVVLISDFLDSHGYAEAVHTLLSRGSRLFTIQVLDKLDLGHGLEGHLRLRDSETGQERRVFIDDSERMVVKESVDQYCESLARFCHNSGQGYMRAMTDQDYLELVCHALKSEWGPR